MPNGSYQGAHTTTSAERSSAGTSARATGRRSRTRSVTPCRAASARRRAPSRVGVELALAPVRRRRPAPRPARAASASTMSSTPLRAPAGRRRRPARGRRRAQRRRRRGGSASRSTPQGTTAPAPGRAQRISSSSSSSQVAMTRVDAPGEPRARADAVVGLVSAAPWWRRLTEPSAWKVCTSGMPSRARRRAARPARTSRSGRGRRRVVGRPASAAQATGQGGHVPEDVVLRDRAGRPGDRRGRRRRQGAGRRSRAGRRVVAAGVDRDLVAAAAVPGQLGDVDVLSTGVDAAEVGEGAGVLGDHGDPHQRQLLQQSVPVGRGSGAGRTGPARLRGRLSRRRARRRGPRPAAQAHAERARSVETHAGAGGHGLRALRSSPSATIGMPSSIASISDSPSEVQRSGCR